MTLLDFLDCLTFASRAGPQHPSLLGWATVASHAACAGLALAVLNLRGRAAGRGFWRMVVAVSVVLALNEAVGAQWAVAALGECIAQRNGWYGGRAEVQRTLVALILVVAALLFTILIIAARRHVRGNWLAATGLLLLVNLAGIRMISLHGLDRVLERPVAVLSLAAMLEILGVGLIVLNAVRHLMRPPPVRRRHQKRGARTARDQDDGRSAATARRQGRHRTV